MATESTREKGKRLYEAGDVTKLGHDRYEVAGGTGKYLVERRGTFLQCPCPSRRGDCSHVEAVHCAIGAEVEAQAAPATSRWLDKMTSGLVDLQDDVEYAGDDGDQEDLVASGNMFASVEPQTTLL